MADTEKPTTSISLEQFARLVANLYRNEADDCVITIGDWKPSPISGREPLFHGTIRVTVGDFRRWTREGTAHIFAAIADERERCAKLIESGAGMADLIDDDLLETQASYIRGTGPSLTAGQPSGRKEG